jgi:hypothetical protein
MDTPSPSRPTATSVRFLFLMPLILHTLAAWMRPLVEPIGRDSVAKVKGAPICSWDDMVFARPSRGDYMRSAWVVAGYARTEMEAPATGKKVGSSGRKWDARRR